MRGRARLWLARLLWGWVPHPTQRQWLLDHHSVKVAACGRRWGKTEAAAVDAATFALCSPGSVQMIVSPTYDQSKLIFDTVERLLCKAAVTRKMVKVVRTPYPRITIGNSLIMARTADEDGRNLRGHSADRVIVDEAAYVRDAVVDEVIAPMLADRDGQLIMISTPAGRNHFYRAFIRGSEPTGPPSRRSEAGENTEGRAGAGQSADAGCPALASACRGHSHPEPVEGSNGSGRGDGDSRYASFRFPSWLNPHISRSYIEHQRTVMTERQFRVEYEAEFLDDRNAVFCWEDIQKCVVVGRTSQTGPTGQTGPTADAFTVAGVDWARYSDYTAVVVLDAGALPLNVVAIDRFQGLPWSAQIERVADLFEAHRASIVMTDQTSIGDPLLEQLRQRLAERGRIAPDVRGLTFTAQSKRTLVDNLAIRLAHGRLRIPNDEALVRELQYFEFETTASGGLRMNARSGYHDDLVIALALAAWAAEGAGPGDYMTSGRAVESGGDGW